MTFPKPYKSTDLLKLWDTGIDDDVGLLGKSDECVVGKQWTATICRVGKGRETRIDDNMHN